ncbi:hypothetical protein [Halococcus qingdaonensis]|uniref:hypothetical protein n=1 Tax=Halococcus qingdaonensis TaxID=224402 RepID=UPI00211679C9|nr:hypothetical protein [Halococcus qingdaonensis]
MNIPLSIRVVVVVVAVLLVDIAVAAITESHAAAIVGWWLVYLLSVLGAIAILDVVARVGRIVLRCRGCSF